MAAAAVGETKALCAGKRRYLRTPRRGRLLDRDNLHRSDVGVRREQLGRDAGERLRDLAVEVGVSAVLILERVEDAVGRLADRERAALLEEPAELASLLGLGLEQSQHTEFDGHTGPFIVGLIALLASAPSRAACCRRDRAGELILPHTGLDSPD